MPWSPPIHPQTRKLRSVFLYPIQHTSEMGEKGGSRPCHRFTGQSIGTEGGHICRGRDQVQPLPNDVPQVFRLPELPQTWLVISVS